MEFIPILEEDGTIRQVGEWLLNEALAQAALWRMENPDFVISVNVSYIQILQEGFREMVTRIVEESGTPEKQLILELTESCKVSDPNGLRDDFEYFKNMGINMALDDFGTGVLFHCIASQAETTVDQDRSYFCPFHSG